MRFKDKVVVITGASGGVGKLLADAFKSEGAKICAIYRTRTILSDQYDITVGADLSLEWEAKNVVEIYETHLGPADILINCAAINVNGLIESVKPSDFEKVLKVNLVGTFNMVQHSIKNMKSGRIINIGSIVGSTGAVGCSSYVASKAGLEGLTKALALELANRQILVNLLELGYFEVGLGLQFKDKLKEKLTSKIPLKIFGDPNEIIKAAFYLAEVNYMTGNKITLAGGL